MMGRKNCKPCGVLLYFLLGLTQVISGQIIYDSSETKIMTFGSQAIEQKPAAHSFALDKDGKYYRLSGHSSSSDPYGIMDKKGNVVLPAVFSKISRAGDDYFVAVLGNNFALFDKNFNILLPPDFEYLEKTNVGNFFIAQFKTDFKYSLIDEKGNIVLGRPFKKIKNIWWDRSNSIEVPENAGKYVAVYDSDDRIAFYDTKKNKFSSDFIFTEIISAPSFFNVSLKTGKRLLLDFNLKMLVPDSFDKITNSSIYENSILYIEKNGKKGILSASGKYIAPVEYDEITAIHSYGFNHFITNKRGIYRFIDNSGKPLANNKAFRILKKHTDSKYLYAKNYRTAGLISVSGNEFLPMIYDTIVSNDKYFFGKRTGVIDVYDVNGIFLKKINCDFIKPVNSLYYFITKGGKKALYNETLEEPLSSYYDDIDFMYAGTAAFIFVKQNNLWGILNIKNEAILPLEYDLIRKPLYIDNKVIIKKGEKYGLFNVLNAEFINKCECDLLAENNSEKKIICVKGNTAVLYN